MIKIKLINIKEIEEVMKIISDAKELLSHESLQWQQGYPNKDTMENDINNGDLFGLYEDDMLKGVIALVIGKNPYYEKIFEGKWNIDSNELDLVIHRIAVSKNSHHKGYGDTLIKYAIEYAKERKLKSIKSDTHEKNLIMQHLLISNSFIYKGLIELGRDEIDNMRLAYELDL